MGFNNQKDKDPLILWALFEYRYLQSGQLEKITGRSNQVIRRRIRNVLKPERYVIELKTALHEESAYTLGPKGFEYIAAMSCCETRELPYSKGGAKVKPIYWQHILMTNNIRIDFSLAMKSNQDLELIESIPEWQMDNPQAKKKEERFTLWERPYNADKTRQYPFRPDGMFLIQYPASQSFSDGMRLAMFLEADRGTESIVRIIKNKYMAYRYYYNQQTYHARFLAHKMAILFVLDDIKTNQRIKNMQRQLQIMASDLNDKEAKGEASFVKFFRFTRSDLINPDSIIENSIWENWQGEKRSLYKKAKH